MNDPSYAVYSRGSTDSDPLVLAGKTAMMNRINQIYNDDLAVRMLLVNGTDKLNFQTITEATGANGPCGGAACYTAAEMDRLRHPVSTRTPTSSPS